MRPGSFNTQPPEGGCGHPVASAFNCPTFQHTAARRRLPVATVASAYMVAFQHTAARRRLRQRLLAALCRRCFNTQPPEGGCCYRMPQINRASGVSTHSRPKAAAGKALADGLDQAFQHTAARRRLLLGLMRYLGQCRFQHTAARRRLPTQAERRRAEALFQHTAARRRLRCVTTWPGPAPQFQHTAARRRLPASR